MLKITGDFNVIKLTVEKEVIYALLQCYTEPFGLGVIHACVTKIEENKKIIEIVNDAFTHNEKVYMELNFEELAEMLIISEVKNV